MARGRAGQLLLLLQLSLLSCSAGCRQLTGLGAGPCIKLQLEATLKSGLINQHLSLLSFVTIGVACGADELLVTAASSRDLFRRDANWFDVDFNKLWNATALAAFLQGHGVRLLVGAQGEDAALRLGGLHLFPPHRDFSDICVHLRNHVAAQLAGRRAAPQQGAEEALTISVPVTGLLHSTLSQRSQLHADVARSVRFSDPLQLLADTAAARLLERTGARAFNSAHLRIEDDFHVTASARPAVLRAYADAFQAAGLAAGLPLYLASGIFESEPGFAGAWRHGHASAHAHKEALLEVGELAALQPEQRAAVDFLVAVRAERFVGWATSSFSFWVAEARALAGLPPEASHLIHSPGSEASLSAFARANGVLLPPGATHGLAP